MPIGGCTGTRARATSRLCSLSTITKWKRVLCITPRLSGKTDERTRGYNIALWVHGKTGKTPGEEITAQKGAMTSQNPDCEQWVVWSPQFTSKGISIPHPHCSLRVGGGNLIFTLCKYYYAVASRIMIRGAIPRWGRSWVQFPYFLIL